MATGREVAKLRAWWSHRQGLDGRLQGNSPETALAETGWARSVGGSAPYLTLAARTGAARESIDASVAALRIHELPAARGCTYVVPPADFALALKAGESFADADLKTAYKLGVTDKEIQQLCEAVQRALEKGAMDPEQIREATGTAARNLGEAGKKKGLTTTLPLALGRLQARGAIRRVPMNGRLDQQRYRYGLWKPNPLDKCRFSAEEALTELARRFFSWIGPASIVEFQRFAASTVKATRAAVEGLRLESLGSGDGDLLMLPEDRSLFESFKTPAHSQYVLTAGLDGLALLRRDMKSMIDAADMERTVMGDKGAVHLGGLSDLPSHAIFDRGRLVGLWEYDPATESIAWMSWIKRNRELEQAVAHTEAVVRDQLGDARSFSLDSPKSRIPRIDALRKAASA